ncbi:FliM/FliN family flagellar motor switch protein [Vibrio sp. SS-MA-C1-2]|uniref:FliM/FliN family flagellar motor switch protein n=1 Tax=Vibrio sp. SS-MA-C1-2 TaxID=2908646 RepID=UPI001F362811|nr:FliM/FliN family flagellar motor switch protein [Vibrio sp. SS-MA-C1-2]UJF18015.1 FliM/FliN family flagellar motor switch protein [Vibrio sp. SS-MA-C1-2]
MSDFDLDDNFDLESDLDGLDFTQDDEKKEKGNVSTKDHFQSINNIPVEITVQVSKKSVLLSELATLNTGSVLMLDKQEGEPVDIVVNGVKLGTGEIIEQDGVLGVKVLSVDGNEK